MLGAAATSRSPLFNLVSVRVKVGGVVAASDAVNAAGDQGADMSGGPQTIEGSSAATSRPFDFRLLTMSAFEPFAHD